MSELDAGAIATRCLGAWSSGDFGTVRSLLRDDVTSVGPMGDSEGADDYIAGLEVLAQVVVGVDQKQVLVDGDDVCIAYDLVTAPAGPLPSSSWFHILDGKIDRVQAYFDARPFDRAVPSTPAPAASRVDPTLVNGPRTWPVFSSAEREIADGDDTF